LQNSHGQCVPPRDPTPNFYRFFHTLIRSPNAIAGFCLMNDDLSKKHKSAKVTYVFVILLISFAIISELVTPPKNYSFIPT
jgi:hypothetical protein